MSANVNDDFLKEVVSEYYEEEIYAKDKMDELVPSDEFRENMDRLIKSVDKSSRNKKKCVIRLKWAACVASVLIVASVVVGMNNGVQAGCLDFIKSLFAGGFDGYETVEDSDDLGDIVGFRLGYVPEGYELVSEEESVYFKSSIYNNKYGSRLLFRCYDAYGENYTLVDNEYRKHDVVKLDDGTRCDYYIDNLYTSESNLIWKKDGYICYLIKDGSDEECNLVRIANKVIPIYK